MECLVKDRRNSGIPRCRIRATCNSRNGRSIRTNLPIAKRRGSAEHLKEIIARRIVEAAKSGERDPEQLCRLALKELGFNQYSTGTG